MTVDTYNFWVNWRLGLITRDLTKKEEADIWASEFAMNLLVPLDVATGIINRYGELVLNNKNFLDMIAGNLKVPRELVIFQLQEALNQKDNKEIKSK